MAFLEKPSLNMREGISAEFYESSDNMIKQAIILAAGNGRRMSENSTDQRLKNTPKPLLEVKGMPLIEYKVRRLVENGMRVCIVINPAHESMFRQKLRGYDIEYSYQAERLGTANALYSAKDFVKDELYLVLMGDDIVEFDVKKIARENKPAIFGFEVDDVTGYGVPVVNEKGFVENVREKELSGKGIVNTGMYIMPKEFFKVYRDIVPNQKSGEYYLFSAFPLLSKIGIKFKLVMLDYWFGINTPVELQKAHEVRVIRGSPLGLMDSKEGQQGWLVE